MGHMLKNTVPRNGSHAIGIPVGTSTIGPDQPTVGQARWNTTTSKLEYYNGASWAATAHEGTVNIIKDSFSGNAVATTFTMSQSYASGTEANVLVFVGQVYQNPGVAYTFNGSTTITFTSAPPSGTNNIRVRYLSTSLISLTGPLVNDLLINGLTVGKGTGNVSTNTAVGVSALISNTT